MCNCTRKHTFDTVIIMCIHIIWIFCLAKRRWGKKNFSELIGKNWKKRENEEKAKENVNICEKTA